MTTGMKSVSNRNAVDIVSRGTEINISSSFRGETEQREVRRERYF